MKVVQRSLLGYLPAQVIQFVLDGGIKAKQDYPIMRKMETVSLFADLISDTLKLEEENPDQKNQKEKSPEKNNINNNNNIKTEKKATDDPEFMAFCFNRYMELLINIIGKNGGDIIKFVGETLMVIWPSLENNIPENNNNNNNNNNDDINNNLNTNNNKANNNLRESCIRAFQCALQIMKLNKLDMGGGKKLSVKVGIGVGECWLYFVGGTFNRSEFLIIGDAVKQACTSKLLADEGKIVVSQPVYDYIGELSKFEKVKNENKNNISNFLNKENALFFYIHNSKDNRNTPKIQVRADAFLMSKKFSQEKLADNINILRTFVPAAITNYLDIEMENWCKEIRLLTIMFIHLNLYLNDTEDENETDQKTKNEKIQNVVLTIQRCVYRTRGSVNKFIIDDKGAFMLCCWGLPPFSSAEDPVRAVLSAKDIVNDLTKRIKVKAFIGIATGSCFTGVCGSSGGRREYSLLGEIVSDSHDYMEAAAKGKEKNGKCIFVCEKTKDLIQNKIFCEMVKMSDIKLKKNVYSPVDDIEPMKLTLEAIYQKIKTHRNNKINENDPSYEIDNNNDSGIGLGYEKKIINEKYQKVLQGESQAILITGIIGSGKSLLLRSQISHIIRKSDNSFLNNMSRILFISNQTPITHTKQMNGFQEGMKKMFYELTELRDKDPNKRKYFQIRDGLYVHGDAIFNLIFITDNFRNIRYIEEILDYDLTIHYSIVVVNKKNKVTIDELKPLEISGDPYFFVRDYEKIKNNLATFFLLVMVKYQKHVLKGKLPLIYIVEDCQQLDSLSVELIKLFLSQLRNRAIKNTLLICSFQSLICDLKDLEKEKYLKLNKELEEAFNLCGTIIQMKPFVKSEDVAELIKQNITTEK